jgi:hypothetical protein
MENNENNRFLLMDAKAQWKNLLYPVELVLQPRVPHGVNQYLVVRKDNGQVLSVVSDQYSLVTNEEALGLGKSILEKLLNESMGNMIPTNIRSNVNNTRFLGSFIPEEYEFEIMAGDKWTPFIYIQNSYDKTFPFRCWVGMGRVACLNGLIFGDIEVKINVRHLNNIKHNVLNKVFANLADKNFTIQKGVYSSIFQYLMEIPIERNLVRPLVCKFFMLLSREDDKNKIIHVIERIRMQNNFRFNKKNENIIRFMKIIDDKWNFYSGSLGHNAYALYNVISDISTHEASNLRKWLNIQITPVQLIIEATRWAENFAEFQNNKNFNIHEYIKEYLFINDIPTDIYSIEFMV